MTISIEQLDQEQQAEARRLDATSKTGFGTAPEALLLKADGSIVLITPDTRPLNAELGEENNIIRAWEK